MLDWVLNMVLARNILTIDICKVIFCRLMILYTKYCPMRSLYVPARNGFHSALGEMVLFVTITAANVVLYWAMILHI